VYKINRRQAVFRFFLFLKLKLREKLETSLVIEGFKDITIQYYSSNQFSLHM